jgi:hypothetical protein
MKFNYKNANGTLSEVEVLNRENDLVYVCEGGTLYFWCKDSELVAIEEKQPYQMTPKQYHEHVIKKTMNRYSNCSRAKAEMCHPKQRTDEKHLELLIKAIEEGNIIPVRVIDKLTDGQRYRLTHDYPNYFDQNPYFSPEIRGRKLHPLYSK